MYTQEEREAALEVFLVALSFPTQVALNCHVLGALHPPGVGHRVFVFLLACFGSGRRGR